MAAKAATGVLTMWPPLLELEPKLEPEPEFVGVGGCLVQISESWLHVGAPSTVVAAAGGGAPQATVLVGLVAMVWLLQAR